MSHSGPVLLGEDDPHDIFFMERAFDRVGVVNPLIPLHNGAEVIKYLEARGPYADRVRFPDPHLLLLDLKMPLLDGFEVLSWIRQQPNLADMLPVIVLSSSAHESDVQRAFDLGAHEYLVKPSGFEGLVALVQDLKQRWLDPARAQPSRLRPQPPPGASA